VSPKHNPQNVCLGVQKGNTGNIVFVPRNDTTRRLVLGGGDDLIILRAWYGGPHNHSGQVHHGSSLEHGWLWQTGDRKGKDVTKFLRSSVCNGELNFNSERRGCNDLFGFGHEWQCHKILVVQYKYGKSGQVQTWFSESVGGEPYHCLLPASPPPLPGLKGKKLTFRQHIEQEHYTREAADNLFYGVPELRGLLDAGLISTAPGHPHNADYQFRTIAEVGAERSHAFAGNVPPFGFKYACTPKSNGAAVPFNDGWATTYHGPSRLCNVLGIASAGLRPCAPGASNFHPGCEGKIYVTPSVTVAWQAYSCQVTQKWRRQRQTWRLLFQCRADESKVHKQHDTTSLAAVRAGPAFNVDDPLSVDPHLRHDELEWVLEDATRVHVHGLCLIPFPWGHDPYHNHLDGCMAELEQKKRKVKATLTLHARAPPVTEAALEAALVAASAQLHCGAVVVTNLVLNVPKPHAYMLFMSDLAARVAVEYFAAHAGRSVHVEGFDVGLRMKLQ
jgi:hypothetical protein